MTLAAQVDDPGTGRVAEAWVAERLQRAGYVLARRAHGAHGGDIDLTVRRGQRRVVEVKGTRVPDGRVQYRATATLDAHHARARQLGDDVLVYVVAVHLAEDLSHVLGVGAAVAGEWESRVRAARWAYDGDRGGCAYPVFVGELRPAHELIRGLTIPSAEVLVGAA